MAEHGSYIYVIKLKRMNKEKQDQWIQGLTLLMCFIIATVAIMLKYYLTGEI